ncbi:PfkB family carbohydrate kinase [Streptomyces sp. NPDC059564]|uniref:PfkB family carbohydrate kinase n=1 Tax=Streptomyces sp. NPDC059564 TaxID=3346865 RepID=UPI0036B430B7
MTAVAGSVLVTGEALTDLVPVSGRSATYAAVPGGAPANVAVCLARIGVPVSFAGTLGGDAFAAAAEERLLGAGVDLSLCGRSPLPTALALAGDGRHGADYVFHTDRTATFQPPPPLGGLDRFDAVYVGGLAAVVEPAADAVADAVRESSGTVLAVDPNVRRHRALDDRRTVERLRQLCGRADLIKISDEDAVGLWPGRDPAAVCRVLADSGPLVVLTRGAGGSTAFLPSGGEAEVRAVRVEVVNTIGAGDAFMAAMLAWLQAVGALGVIGPSDITCQQARDMLTFGSRAAAAVCAGSDADFAAAVATIDGDLGTWR